MNSKICHDTLVGMPEYFQKHQHLLLSIVELTIFYIAKLRFSRILSHPFWYKSHFFEQRKDECENLSRYTCWHTRVLSETWALLLSIVELAIFYIAKVRFSRILSHPFWYKSHFFDQRKDEFEDLSRYTCWQTRVLSKTPAPVALHRRAYHILHCTCAIFPNFEPSLLIQKSFFWAEKRWIRKSVTIHLLAYQSTFGNMSPVALHRRACHILHCKGAIFPNFEPSLLIQKSFYWPEKRWIRKSVTIHLLACQSTFKNTSSCCSPS